jgi:molybdenum cofactor biosynthesis protein B
MSESAKQHREAARASGGPVACAVLTISDTRSLDDDPSGDLIGAILAEAGHTVIERGLVRDEARDIGEWIDARLRDARVQAILTTGGTGIAARDTTIEVVRQRFTVELEGFGELFRMLSWEQVGAAAMLSRACAGLCVPAGRSEGVFLFAMPGSRNAVETAMRNLVAPELAHLVWERRR